MRTTASAALLIVATTSMARGQPSAAANSFGVDVRSFGARGDGVTDDTSAIQRAIDSRPDGRIAVYFPSTAAAYVVTRPLRITKDRVNLVGDGAQASILTFEPLTPGALLQFSARAKSLFQCSVRHLGLGGSNAIRKTAIEAIDVREFTVEDVGIYPWNGGGRSVGLHLAGREFIRVVGSSIHADTPIVISPNPNSVISLDHTHIQDVHLIADGMNPVITVESGANLTDVIFDGAQAWVRGTYGLYWADHDSKTVSFGVVLANIRREQSIDPRAYSVYIEHHQTLQNLSITNLYADIHQRGVFLSHTAWTTISNFMYAGTHEAINASAKTNTHLVITNSWFQRGSSVAADSAVTPAADGWVHLH